MSGMENLPPTLDGRTPGPPPPPPARPVLDYRRSNDAYGARRRIPSLAGFAVGVAIYVGTCAAAYAAAAWTREFGVLVCALFLIPPVALGVAGLVELEMEWPAVMAGATTALLLSLTGCCGLLFLRC